jgi:plasmid stabilization system protein ParE
MVYKIKVNRRFEVKVAKTYEFIVKEWGYSVGDAFYARLLNKLNILQKQPFIGKISTKRPAIRRVLLEKHNIIYYYIDRDTIVLVNFLNSKKDPKRNPYD